MCKDNDNSVVEQEIGSLPISCKISYHNNFGADVAPFLQQLHDISEPLFIKIHSKKSNLGQKNQINWRAVLNHSLIGNNTIIKHNIEQFNNSLVGMISCKNLIFNNQEGLNIFHIKKLCSVLGVKYSKIINKKFVAGNMFMSRTNIFKQIFNKSKIKQIIPLLSKEKGPVKDLIKGKYTHALERIFGYIIGYNNLILAGINPVTCKIKNTKAPNGYFNLNVLYNNDCYIIEDLQVYGEVIQNSILQKQILWLHTVDNIITKYQIVDNNIYKNISDSINKILPKNFDWKFYINYHNDLKISGIKSKQEAICHYLSHGCDEKRIFSPIQNNSLASSSGPEFWNSNNNILYFSPHAPDYDESSGGNRLLEILKILQKELKYNVWFMCNAYKNEKHIKVLKDMGIRTFVTNTSKKEYLDKYLIQAKEQNIVFDNVIFSWYDIATQYMDIVKSIYPDIKIIVDSVDVHWVREQRGRDINEVKISKKILDQKKEIEKNVYSKANVVFAITENDKHQIQKEIGYQHNIKILSNIHDTKNTTLGSNIFFIGNYDHQPNTSAVLNCIKIYKSFQKTQVYKKLLKKPKLYIVGSNLPISIYKKIKSNKNIVYTGQISNINTIYKQSCLLLSPLSWGAGIKGKICDSGMSGLPILTSDIGNEGINFINKKNALIANSNREFVKQLTYFFNLNKKQQRELGKAGQKHLNDIVSKKAAINILKHSLKDKHVIISIVTYNQPVKLKKCIDSILSKTKYSNYTIVVTDNSSNLKNQKIIKSYQTKTNKIKYIKNNTNKYFIEPNNKIINDPKNASSDIVLINDDIEILDEYWLNYLYSSAYSADYIAAAGGKTIYPNGTLAEAGAELYNDGFGRNKGRYEDPNNLKYNIPHYTGYCSGCLVYYRRDAIDKIGSLNTKLIRMYYDDSEWQYRSHIHGLKTIYDPRCIAIHDEGSSAGTDITKGSKKYQEINRLNFLQIMHESGVFDIERYN